MTPTPAKLTLALALIILQEWAMQNEVTITSTGNSHTIQNLDGSHYGFCQVIETDLIYFYSMGLPTSDPFIDFINSKNYWISIY